MKKKKCILSTPEQFKIVFMSKRISSLSRVMRMGLHFRNGASLSESRQKRLKMVISFTFSNDSCVFPYLIGTVGGALSDTCNLSLYTALV